MSRHVPFGNDSISNGNQRTMKSITREELPKNALAVIVGRFACLHLGHQHLIQTAIDECGLENTLVIIGSENVIDDRTPFSPVDRATWIYSVFPCVCLTWIKDYDDDTMWENRLDDIHSQHDGKPVFYTGSLDDVKWLSEDAMVRVVDSDLYVRRHKYIDG